MASGQFVKLYYVFMDEYEGVWNSDPQLALFMRLLVIADKWYPQFAPIGRRNGAYRSLLESGLVLENKGGTGYTIRGLSSEREHRSASGRNAAASRWSMPNRAKQNRTEHRDANASRTSSGNGWSPVYEAAPGEALVPRHEGQHPDCIVCEPMRSNA